MKKITRIVPVVLGALALASCSSDELFSSAALEATQTEGDEMIAVVDENPDAVTRYGLDNASTMFVWSTGDRYTVFDQTLTKSAEYTLNSKYSGSKAGLFEPDGGKASDIVDGEGNSTARYGVFPYRVDNGLSYDFPTHKWTLFMTLDPVFAYEKIINGENGDLGTNEGAVAPLPLWGAVSDNSGSRKITFKMMTGLLKVDLSEIPDNIASSGKDAYLIVESATHQLSGSFKADITEATAAEYSAEAGDVVLEPNGSVTDNQIKVTFNTDGKFIANRVFYLPIPVGEYAAGDLTIKLFDGNGTEKADMTPEAWKSSQVKIERGKGQKIEYIVAKDFEANSIAEINKKIANALLLSNEENPIVDGKTFTFNISGAELVPTATDNMLLIPTFNGKNINVILNIQNDIDASGTALNIAEADYGVKNDDNTGKWTVKGGKTPEVIKDDADAAKRTFILNLEGTTDPNSNVNILAPTSNIFINTLAAGNTIKTLDATTANEANSLQLGVEGDNLTPLVGTTVTSRAGGVFVGTCAAVGTFENTDNNDVNVFGNGLEKFTKNGSGTLIVEKGANVVQLLNSGTGDIIVNGQLYNSASYTHMSLQNTANAAIVINGTAGNIQTKSTKKFIAGPGAFITSLVSVGSGEILIQGAAVTTLTNNGNSVITVAEDVNGSLPAVKTINLGDRVGATSVSANNCNLVINNKSRSSNIVVDFAYNKGAKTDAAWTATITDDSNVMTGTAGGNMTVKNTSGIVTLTNIGGNVELDNCSGFNVIDNDTEAGATITLNNSYVATLTNSNSTTATVNTSGKAGIGNPSGAFTFVDAAWDGKVETHNEYGNIYTAAQLAGLTYTPTPYTKITLKTNIDLNNKTWAGIKQGAMTVFDGGNFTVSNLKLKDADQIGLFATAGTDLTIQNLTLNTVKFATTGEKNCIGALVGEFNGGSLTVETVTVKDVDFDAGSDATNSNSVAALVGKFTGNDLMFNKTVISGTSTIKGTSSLAGFVGNLGASNNVEFNSSKLSGLTITVQGTPDVSNAPNAVAGRVGYLIGGVSGDVAYLKVNTNCAFPYASLTNDQRIAWKYKNRKVNDGIFFWGDARGWLGYCQGTITTYKIGDKVQNAGDEGDYNIYKGY